MREYDDFDDEKATVPFTDYRKLEEKNALYKTFISTIDEILEDPQPNDIEEIKIHYNDFKEELRSLC
ncbi:MAG: hypothetical protein J6B89_03605 [Bacilli bacterium]|nr:hypothetical protein [Bacilli bacterium]